ncbi:hypothetical protein CAPTEDRAFT_162120 [Capitella teleta]|uniref:1-acylglycerol-3-phosphate O-acyltransferase ABHD5 n=1 Tax=Capitella teleta TaxID=283909 RepID=R7TIL9_CAPTE|nr:hypothetical protein CAPTEDRAFT_162120 [Capitella teleta]|eukprot:ELT93584.1 hypothetical protein CAPTEDRAFT_162120 [Capitella teleta]
MKEGVEASDPHRLSSSPVVDLSTDEVAPRIPATSSCRLPALIRAEKKILSHVWSALESIYVPIYNGKWKLRTVSMNKQSEETPVVLVHGMGAGVGFWALNLRAFASVRPVHAFDVLGFGQSSRPDFPTDASLAENEFVESIEEWRKSMDLDKFILLGHSLGGFLAASYTIKYPERVKHLILADPWGFPNPPDIADGPRLPLFIRGIIKVLQSFNPFSFLRAAGPFGPRLVRKLRSDLTQKFSHMLDEHTVSDYIYQCNAQKPSGEVAFKNMYQGLGYAKHPMVNRITDIPPSIPMTFVHGEESWIGSDVAFQVKDLRGESLVDIQLYEGASHHVYADNTEEFNRLVDPSYIDQYDHGNDGDRSHSVPSRTEPKSGIPAVEDLQVN